MVPPTHRFSPPRTPRESIDRGSLSAVGWSTHNNVRQAERTFLVNLVRSGFMVKAFERDAKRQKTELLDANYVKMAAVFYGPGEEPFAEEEETK